MKKILILFAISILAATTTFAAESNTDAMLQYNQGIDFYKIGQYDKAITCFKSSINLDPDYIDAYYNLGSILEYLGQYDAALAVFKQIIVRQPSDYDSVYKAAWLSFQLGEYAKAKTYLSIVPTNSPRGSDVKALTAQINSKLSTSEAVNIKPPQIKQANNIYQNIAGPTGITTDEKGNVYVAEFNDNTILKITPSDEKVVFLKDSKINGPIGLAMDKAGNMYIANYNKDNVLKVSALGEISVMISNVQKPYCLWLQGNILFVSCQGTNSVLKYKLHN